MTLSADLRRWAVFAVWESESSLVRFVESAAAVRRWERAGAEAWHGRLGLVRARGAWAGTTLVPAPHAPVNPRPDASAPSAFLTHAAIRPSRLAAFYRAIAPVEAELLAHPERVRSVGVGEWPVARQATFSLWRRAAGARDFAYGRTPHTAVVRRTRDERWYSEELFAQFSVQTLAGTWDGADPLG